MLNFTALRSRDAYRGYILSAMGEFWVSNIIESTTESRIVPNTALIQALPMRLSRRAKLTSPVSEISISDNLAT